MAHEPIAIANEVLKIAEQRGIPITIMKLIKLVYFAHGWTLALLNRPLTDEPPEAWQHGPVYPSIYRAFRGSGWSNIKETAKNPFTGAEYRADLDTAERSILGQVVDKYGKFHAFELSGATHEAGTPWDEVYNGDGRSSDVIPNRLIKEHFDKLRADA